MKNNKCTKYPKYFIVKFPDMEEALIKCNSWSGLIPYSKYIKDEYCDNTILVAVHWWEALKYILKGKVFQC